MALRRLRIGLDRGRLAAERQQLNELIRALVRLKVRHKIVRALDATRDGQSYCICMAATERVHLAGSIRNIASAPHVVAP